MPENLIQYTSQGHRPKTLFNPFPGLRPYSFNESHLFFGREGQSEEVLKHLASKRFVAVIGASGSGKSSLMFCGLVPVLYGGFISSAGSRWKIITTRPGNNPVGNLAQSIQSASEHSKEEVPVQEGLVSAQLRRSSRGLAEAIGQQRKNNESFLIIVDQFEELFRYKKSGKDDLTFNEAESYVKLLVEAVKQSEVPIYMVLTMRSDFIGDCSQFQELTALINESNYLIPRMSRNDMKKAVTGPVAVGGASIDPLLVQTLLNEIGDNPDQLPILQHALMRTWEYWMNQGNISRPLSMADYEAIGKMEKALSEHANEAYDELDEEGKRICESMFKTLTEKGSDNRGIRHPTRIEVIAEISKSEPAQVIRVIEKFRSTGRSFLSPSHEVPLSNSSVIDLSHESLMRIWNRLKAWVEEESNAVQMYTRLSEAASMYQAGKTGLWRPPDLQLATNWREKQNPTLTWARRYNPAFERAMVFLETSEKNFKKEEENKLRLQKRQLRRTRLFAIVLGTAAIISLGLTVYSQMLRVEAIKQKTEADQQRAKADSNATIATQQRQIAEDALVQAELNRIKAENKTMEADSQRRLAVSSAQLAIQRQLEANEQRKLAEKNAFEANTQKIIATNKSEEAFKRRMLSISQSMAVKSLQIDNDKNLKGLVSYQAYLFNDRYQGPSHQPDIYQGLYASLKLMNNPGYNVLKGHEDAVKAVVFVPHTNIAYSTGADGKILRWDMADTTRGNQLIIQNQSLNEALAISPDGKWLACATKGLGLQMFNLSTPGVPAQTINLNGGEVRSLAFSPDNQFLYSTGSDNMVDQLDLKSMSVTRTVFAATRINKLEITPDGKILAAGTRDGEFIFWYTDQDFTKKVIYQEKDNAIFCIAASNNGKWIATRDLQGNIKVWSVDSGKLLGTLRGHTTRVQDLAFDPTDNILGSVSTDGSVRLWDMNDFSNPPMVLKDNGGYVVAIAFSPDGRLVVTGSTEEDRLVVRPTSSAIIARQMCNKLQRNMSPEEWKTFVGSDIEYEQTCPAANVRIEVK
jgi:WD40 repeat protein